MEDAFHSYLAGAVKLPEIKKAAANVNDAQKVTEAMLSAGPPHGQSARLPQ